MAEKTSFQRRELWYRGNVQGVGFRYRTRSIARHYDLVGFVQNLPDGRVYLVVEGDSDEIDRFVDELGSRMDYYIRDRQQHSGQPTGEFEDFEILF